MMAIRASFIGIISALVVACTAHLPAESRELPSVTALHHTEGLAEQEWNAVVPRNSPLSAEDLRALRAPGLLWVTCKEVPRLGQVCVGVYGDPTAVPSTLGVELKLLNKTFLLPVLGAAACVDDAVLLHLLLTDPHFAAFAKQIQALVAAEKILGAEAVSECVLLTNATVAKEADGSVSFGACPQLQSHWGCFHSRCLHAHVTLFDCFNIHLPHKETEQSPRSAYVI